MSIVPLLVTVIESITVVAIVATSSVEVAVAGIVVVVVEAAAG